MTHPELDQNCWLALHDLCLRGIGTVDDNARPQLVDLGLARETPRGCAPTSDGRDLLIGWARLASGSDEETAARRAYDAFLPLDREVKQIATDWQTRAAAKKAHLDADDWKVVDRLASVDERAGPVVRTLGERVSRFDTYRPRLRAALKRINEGEYDYLTGLLVDSYHTVWWHLHQDLMWALGINRADDPNQ